MNETENEVKCYIVGLIIGALATMFITAGVMNGIWIRKAINTGHGEYNSITGKFQFKALNKKD